MRRYQFQLFIPVISLFLFLVILTYDQAILRTKKGTRGLHINSIVAYSFKKQMELERKQHQCNSKISFRNTIESDINVGINTDAVWQQVDGAEVFLYSAFLDTRLNNYPHIRVVSMVKGKHTPPLYCQIWSDKNANEQPFITEASISLIWSENWNRNDTFEYMNPVLISCLVTSNVPSKLISISTNPCGNTTNLKIINQPTASKPVNNFTLCVKNIHFLDDISQRLVEWLEINRIIGASSIYLYTDSIHANVQRVIDNYEKYTENNTGLSQLSVVSRHAPPEIKTRAEYRLLRDSSAVTSLWQKRRNHLIAYNDCFYRNIYTSRFVVPIDLDEVIVPRFADNWTDLFHKLFTSKPNLEKTHASFMVQNGYFFKNQQIKLMKQNEDSKTNSKHKRNNNVKQNRKRITGSLTHKFSTKTDRKDENVSRFRKPKNYSFKCNKLKQNHMFPNNKTVQIPYFLIDTVRSRFSPPSESGKSFISTKNTLTVFNHYTLQSLVPGIRNTYFVPLKYAQLNHYRNTCAYDILPECVKYKTGRIRDPIILKYYIQLIKNLCKINV